MASSLSSLCGMPRLIPTRNLRTSLRIRARTSGADEEKSSVGIVDANMGVLKERIEMLRTEKRLERCRLGRNDEGWNYRYLGYNDSDVIKKRNQKRVADSLDVAEMAVGTAGLTVVSCTICLCLFSFLLHLG